MNDRIERELRTLKGQLPEPRLELSEAEKDELVQHIGGPLTTQNILHAQKDFALERIPFLFNSLDTQAVVDVLHNDMEQAIKRAHEYALKARGKAPKPRSRS